MALEVGHVEAIFRYPVKSMRGERLEAAKLGWHGIDGDRRLALLRIDDRSGFPWLTAAKLPTLLMFSPFRSPQRSGGLPTHVRTPDGDEMPVFGEDLATESCSMVNYDPDSARPAPAVMKAVIRANAVHAGVYDAVTRPGRLTVVQAIVFHPSHTTIDAPAFFTPH